MEVSVSVGSGAGPVLHCLVTVALTATAAAAKTSVLLKTKILFYEFTVKLES